MDELPSYELRRPDLVLAALAQHLPFDRPRTLLAAVSGVYDDQRLRAWTELWSDPPDGRVDGIHLVDAALERLGVDDDDRLPYRERDLLVSVVVRPGPCWWSLDESEVAWAQRYGRHQGATRHGDVLTVTARGWYSHLDELWGTSPHARWPPELVLGQQ